MKDVFSYLEQILIDECKNYIPNFEHDFNIESISLSELLMSKFSQALL
jgi:hypothetical protein